MKNFLAFLFFTIVLLNAQAQQSSFTGEYSVSVPDGELVLRLQQSGPDQLTGTLVDTNGDQYQVQGYIENGDVSGTIANDGGGMYFVASRAGSQLVLTLIPPDANQQPDYARAQEFAFNARNASPADVGRAGSPGGPLAGKNTSSANWAGAYHGDINGTSAAMTLQQNGAQVSGVIDADGYRYDLSGTASGQQWQGQLKDPQTQGVMPFQGVQQGNQILMTLNANGSAFQIQFTRGNAPSAGAKPTPRNNAPAVNSAQLDQRIIGNWLYSESYTSGEFSFASQWRLIVKPDGTYLYGDAKVAGGGPASSAVSEGGGMTPGQWKTENGVIYIDEGTGWQAYAKYYVEGNSMMLTFGNGSKQVWSRSY